MEDEKMARFINSRGHNLFLVPDGGNVIIHRHDGTDVVAPVKYEGEMHVSVGNNFYHINQFAEVMERNGNTYEPEVPEKVGNFEIVKRIDFYKGRGIALGYCPTAPEPFVTWEFSERNGRRHYDVGTFRKRLATALNDFERRTEPFTTGLYPRKVEYQFDKTDGLLRQRAASKEKEDKGQHSKNTPEPSR